MNVAVFPEMNGKPKEKTNLEDDYRTSASFGEQCSVGAAQITKRGGAEKKNEVWYEFS